jgi:hypothetical protein
MTKKSESCVSSFVSYIVVGVFSRIFILVILSGILPPVDTEPEAQAKLWLNTPGNGVRYKRKLNPG